MQQLPEHRARDHGIQLPRIGLVERADNIKGIGRFQIARSSRLVDSIGALAWVMAFSTVPITPAQRQLQRPVEPRLVRSA